nr:hypothetical protein [Brenneria roseae]
MNMTLNQSIIINKLSVDVKPAFDPEGRIIRVPNPERKPYLITDNHRDSPVGFGVKISTTKKTDIIQRQVDPGQRTATGVKHHRKLSEPRLEMYRILPISIRHAKRLATLLRRWNKRSEVRMRSEKKSMWLN